MSARHGNLQKHQSRNPVQRMLINRFLHTVGTMARKTNATTILDAGSGEGFSAHALREMVPNAAFTCVDVDREALTRGRSMFPDLTFTEGDILRLPFPDASFDLVLCLEVLEHLPDPASAVRELRRVSRDGVIVSTPHEPWFRGSNLLRLKNVRALGNDPEHVNHWNRRTLPRFLEASGLRVRETVTSFPWVISGCGKS